MLKKHTLHVYITNPVAYLEGDTHHSWHVLGEKYEMDNWVYLGEIEAEFEIDHLGMVTKSIDTIAAKKKELTDKHEAEISKLDAISRSLAYLEHHES